VSSMRKTGDLLMMENPGRHVWTAVSIDLEFLPLAMAAVAASKAKSARYALSCASAERAAVMNDKACCEPSALATRVEFSRSGPIPSDRSR